MQQQDNGSFPPSRSQSPRENGRPLSAEEESALAWSSSRLPVDAAAWQTLYGSTMPEQTATTPLTLTEVRAIAKRRWNVILYSVLLCSVLGLLVSLLTPPTYESAGLLLVEPSSMKVSEVKSDDPLGDLLSGTRQQYKMETQVMLLESTEIRSAACKILGLRTLEALPDTTVEALPDSDVIRVTASGKSPKLVKGSANALMQSYIKTVGDADGRQLKRALQKVETGTAKAQKDLERAEAKLSEFKRHRGIAELDANREATLATVDRLSGEYETAQAQLTSLRARIAEARSQLAREPQVKPAALSAETDPLVQQVEDQLSARIAERQSLLARYTPDNRKVTLADADIAALQARVRTIKQTARQRMMQVNPSYDKLRDSLNSLITDEKGLANETRTKATLLASQRQKLAQFPSWEQQFARLQRELEIARNNYVLFSTKREDLRLRYDTRHINARVMETAPLPTKPVAPSTTTNLIQAVVLGLVVGVGLALLLEYLDDRVNTADDLARLSHLPTLGTIPHVAEEGLRLTHLVSGFTPVAEAYRALRTSILFAAVDNPLRTLMLTSSTPGEGKSTTTANLAAALVADGRRVILVDGDLRHPTQHKLFKTSREGGLTDVLIGKMTVEQALKQPTEDPRLLLLTAGSPAPNPTELIGSEMMAHLVDVLRQKADIVLFDASPTLAVSDGPLLSARVDGVLFVIASGEAKRGGVRHALDVLVRSRARLLGLVLNKVERGNAGYYYGYGYSPVELPEGGGTSGETVPAIPASHSRRTGSDLNGDK